MPELETKDIQGLVVRGYGSFPEARFLLLAIDDVALARSYLQGLVGRVNTAKVSPEGSAIQVAFTAPGLVKLGVPVSAVASFSREFLEGMDDDVRAESLGDRGHNDPGKWEWGTAAKPHVLLMLYAVDDPTLKHLLEEVQQVIDAGGLHVLRDQDTRSLPDQKEHFGWKDGISMPKIEGVPKDRVRKKKQPSWTEAPIRPGEFVLGYENEYGHFNESPTAEPSDDPKALLPDTRDGTRRDLGLNGTYLVYRQMTQDVPRFWAYLAEHSKEPGEDRAARAIALGAKMVGRWPSGAPLVTSPDRDDETKSNDNAFTYEGDVVGTGCPFGAHIRRANPRDRLPPERSSKDSIEMVRKHQLLRRGRAFGEPLAASMNPRDFLAAGQGDGKPRGLHFICLVAHINRQFELVQRAWINSANFAALFRDGDPIIGTRRGPDDQNPSDEFTCPAAPVRRKYKGMPPFTQVVGGAYFFLPGIKALHFITKDP